MSNLSKIKNLAKSLAKEFSEIPEGQGYLMLFNMLEKEEKATPYTVAALWGSINETLIKNGIFDKYVNIQVDIYGTTDIKYKTYLLGKSVEDSSVKNFHSRCLDLIEKNAVEYLAQKAVKAKESNISL